MRATALVLRSSSTAAEKRGASHKLIHTDVACSGHQTLRSGDGFLSTSFNAEELCLVQSGNRALHALLIVGAIRVFCSIQIASRLAFMLEKRKSEHSADQMIQVLLDRVPSYSQFATGLMLHELY